MMNIPFLKKQHLSRHFFGLLLKEDQGIAMIISNRIGTTQIVDFEKFSYTNGWENLTEDVDEVLYRLESKHKLRLEETIFFVFSHLIDGNTNQIKKPYQAKIKTLAHELELKPLGFIDCREAIVRVLEKKEEFKITAIVVELDKVSLSVFVYKAGRTIFSKNVSRSNDLIGDLNLVFDETKGRILLPTRLILYNSKDLDFEVTKIVTHRWPSDLFIQLPRVEIIQEKEMLDGMIELFDWQINLGRSKEKEPPEEAPAGFVVGRDVKDVHPAGSEVQSDSGKQRPVFLPRINFRLPFNFLIITGLLIIAASIFINELYFHKAKMTVFVPKENLKKSVVLSFGEKGPVDLPVKVMSKTDEISGSKSVTGKKDVGENARGEVVVYNFSKEKVFIKGTTIETKGLSFVFDDEIKVASASLTGDGSAKLPGKGKVKVTASAIGQESNLAKGQTFKIGDLDSETYFAKNETDFGGGSKRQVTTVSRADYDQLKTDVAKKAADKKNKGLDLSPDERIISQLTKSKFSNESYSKEIGEEAETLSLTAQVVTTAYVYQRDELIGLAYSRLAKEMSEGFSLNKKDIRYQIDKIQEAKEADKMTVSVQGKAIKDVDKNRMVKVLLGRRENRINDILKKNFNTTGYSLTLKQPLAPPLFPRFLPFFPKNFELTIDSL